MSVVGAVGATGAAGTEAVAPLSVGGGVTVEDEHALRARIETAKPTRATFFMRMDGKKIKDIRSVAGRIRFVAPAWGTSSGNTSIKERHAEHPTTLRNQDKANRRWRQYQLPLRISHDGLPGFWLDKGQKLKW